MKMLNIVSELSAATRRLLRTPMFSAFAAVTLAGGIGFTTAAYSAIYAFIERSSAVEDVATLVFVTRVNSLAPTTPIAVSPGDYDELTKRHELFSGIAGWNHFTTSLVWDGTSRLLELEGVTGDYFSVTGAAVALGRPLTAADNEAHAPMVVVISDALWHSMFAAAQDVIGRTVLIARLPAEIVGVAAPGFRGVDSSLVGRRAGWIPLSAWSAIESARLTPRGAPARSDVAVKVVARLASSATPSQAAAQVAALADSLDQIAPLPRASGRIDRRWTVLPGTSVLRPLGSREATFAVLLLPALVFLVACTNLANLIISRGILRSGDFAIRSALGASRWRLIQSQLVDVGILALLGGGGGVLLAELIRQWTLGRLQSVAEVLGPTMTLSWHLDAGALAGTFAAIVLAVLTAGVVPALRLSRSSVSGAIASFGSSGTIPQWKGRRILIAIQVGVSVALFFTALMCVRLLRSADTAALGAEVDLARLAVVHLPITDQQFDPTRAVDLVHRIAGEVARVPGVAGVAIGNYLPLTLAWAPFPHTAISIATPARHASDATDAQTSARLFGVFGNLEIMGLRITRGRHLRPEDAAVTPVPILVNDALARDLAEPVDLVGRWIEWRHDRVVADARKVQTGQVVGIFQTPLLGSDAETRIVLSPIERTYVPALSIAARSMSDDARAVVGGVKTAIKRVDANLAIAAAGRADTQTGAGVVVASFVATASGSLAIVAFVLAMTGLYGVLAQTVAMRRREMGLRLALGAMRGRVLTLVLADGLKPVAVGIVGGTAIAIAVRKLIQSGLATHIPNVDASSIAIVALTLFAAAVASCALPARDASRVDPNVVLRDL